MRKPPRTKKRIQWVETPSGCWECISHSLNEGDKGYAQIMIAGKKQHVHRHLYRELFGEIPEGHDIRHKCDNRKCINPEHLETGTRLQNVHDAIARGRHAKGSKNGSAKLKEADVPVIRSLISEGLPMPVIAKKFSVNPATIYDIRRGVTWRSVA